MHRLLLCAWSVVDWIKVKLEGDRKRCGIVRWESR